MTVEDVFSIRGRGLVATGRVEAGSVRVGDEVSVNASLRVPVDGIEMFRKTLDSASEGDNVGLLFKGLAKGDVNRGDVIADV
jgi:translation elongation factor EF-Tu-like GTPase